MDLFVFLNILKKMSRSCCPIEGTCHCAYAKCNDKCPEHYKKKVVSAADRSPGNCCELFECVPGEFAGLIDGLNWVS